MIPDAQLLGMILCLDREQFLGVAKGYQPCLCQQHKRNTEVRQWQLRGALGLSLY